MRFKIPIDHVVFTDGSFVGDKIKMFDQKIRLIKCQTDKCAPSVPFSAHVQRPNIRLLIHYIKFNEVCYIFRPRVNVKLAFSFT